MQTKLQKTSLIMAACSRLKTKCRLLGTSESLFTASMNNSHAGITSFCSSIIKLIVASRAAIRNDGGQFYWEAVASDHLLRSHVLNLFVFIFGGDIANGYELYASLIAVRDIDKHRAEVPHATARSHLFFEVIFIFFAEVWVGGVEDKTHVQTVLIIPAAKGGGVWKQSRLNTTKVIWPAIDF